VSAYRFWVHVHALPRGVDATAREANSATAPQPLPITAADVGEPLPIAFEEAYARFECLERMYVEPDGSFVQRSGQGTSAWQVEGNLYDRAGRLQYVELKGCCPQTNFDDLLQALGWPEARLMFQLATEGLYLGESEFRRFAERQA